jgi:hypothetical protein
MLPAAVVVWMALRLASPGATEAPEPGPGVALPPGLDQVLRDYERAWRARDPRALADLFTSDGSSSPRGSRPFRGGPGSGPPTPAPVGRCGCAP